MKLIFLGFKIPCTFVKFKNKNLHLEIYRFNLIVL